MKTNPHQPVNRRCHPQDLILVSEGVQCANCLVLVEDHRQSTETKEKPNVETKDNETHPS